VGGVEKKLASLTNCFFSFQPLSILALGNTTSGEMFAKFWFSKRCVGHNGVWMVFSISIAERLKPNIPLCRLFPHLLQLK
jgi:hypothetical protein